ncbi:MAG: DUF3572 domain-containing protein [Proteobacteria bacterium]|nr:DUF3572 domain-containing protein [Pseudomonadota bacterium]
MTPDLAESLALRALGWLAAEPERLGGFLAVTGVGPDVLRDRATDSDLLAAVLDHLLADETLLLAFCGDDAADPADVARARRHLPGFAEPM